MTGFRHQPCYTCGLELAVDRDLPDGALVICGACFAAGVVDLMFAVDDAVEPWFRPS